MRAVAIWDLVLIICSFVLGPISALFWPLLIVSVPVALMALILNIVLIALAMGHHCAPTMAPAPVRPPGQ